MRRRQGPGPWRDVCDRAACAYLITIKAACTQTIRVYHACRRVASNHQRRLSDRRCAPHSLATSNGEQAAPLVTRETHRRAPLVAKLRGGRLIRCPAGRRFGGAGDVRALTLTEVRHTLEDDMTLDILSDHMIRPAEHQ